ncbi:MAG: TauD/TfdA family dioxygenase [Acidimicrobiia bacterium]|nr:TauD/TfdA family dioxygenase [Acidimicrobiia bacterium]
MYRHPNADPSAWTGADLDDDRSWCHELDDRARSEIDAALGRVQADDLDLSRIGPAEFPLPSLTPTLASIADQLARGRGFAVLRGLPVQRYELDELERIYWGLCSHLGTGITQNSDASLIHYVTDGALRPNQGRRGVGNPARASLHVDLTDVASLLCVRQAPDNPKSWVASSTRVHNELLSRHPEVLPLLYEGFEWDRLDEHGEGESPTTGYRVPVFSEAQGLVSCRYNRFWMAKAPQRRGGALHEEASRAFDIFDEIADEARFELDFGPGDIQFINNYVVLHGRDAHAEVADENAKRLLLRIWLDVDDARPVSDEAVVRYGIVRHGRLGWTVDQYRAGQHLGAHARHGDGRPVVATTTGAAERG